MDKKQRVFEKRIEWKNLNYKFFIISIIVVMIYGSTSVILSVWDVPLWIVIIVAVIIIIGSTIQGNIKLPERKVLFIEVKK